MYRIGHPSVVPHPNFHPVQDAHALRKAMKGFGSDEKALIDIITRRSNQQRQVIQKEYKTHFGRDLIEDIDSETSGKFKTLLISLLIPSIDYYIDQIHSAIAGLGTDDEVLIEFLCSLSNSEVHQINNAYYAKFGNSLESDIKSDTSGNFKRLLVSLCTGGRAENEPIHPAAARRDATELLKAGELKIGTDESTFNMILCCRSYEQIYAINEEYKLMTGHGVDEAIKKEFSGTVKDGLLAVVYCAINKWDYFASRLYKSMKGLGTDDDQLIRIMVVRSEIDLLDIKAAFEHKYGETLKNWIKGDTSGHYKHCLYSLIREERSS